MRQNGRYDAHFDWCEARHQALVACLTGHKLAVQPAGISLLPSSARLYLEIGRETRISAVEGREGEIRAALGDRRAFVAQGADGRLYVEVPLPQRLVRALGFERLVQQARLAQQVRPAVAGDVPCILGVDDEGKLLLANLAGPITPHILIAGTTGSGKTVLLSGLVLSLALLNRQAAVQLALIDGKGFNLSRFSGLPHLITRPATTEADWPAAVGLIVTKMDQRLAAASPVREPRLALVIDELADVLERWPRLEEELTRLVRKGREVGVHGIFATQRPSAAAVSGSILANMPCRIVGACVSAQEAVLATGQSGTRAQHLPGRGNFIAVAEGGRLIRFTAPLVADGDIYREIERLRDREPAILPAEAPATGGKIVDFVQRVTQLVDRGPGRKVEPPPAIIVEQLVAHWQEHNEWPSARAAARLIGQAEGTKRANAARAQLALKLARKQASGKRAAMGG